MPDVNLCRDEWENLIDNWIYHEKDRALLKRRLLDGATYERLAEEFEMSVTQIKNRVYRAEARLFKHI